ncbi:MAG: hypothetical protein AAF152_18965 [Cyanobacteria bacterium P01_A01_bin.114]
MLEDAAEPDSLFYFIRLTIRRFFRQTAKQLALGLVGVLIILGIGISSPPVDESTPVTQQLSSVQLLRLESPPQMSGRQSVSQFNPAVAQQLSHSRVVTSSLIGHRLTGAHLLTNQVSLGVERLTANEEAVAIAEFPEGLVP